MSKFKRVSLEGSEELFRPTKPAIAETADTITEVVHHARPQDKTWFRTLHLTEEEVDLLLRAIQAAKYPDRVRGKLPLFKHEQYDEIRAKLQGERTV